MSAVATPSVTGPTLSSLDQILFEICEELQLPPYRRDQAERRYKAVADILEAEQSPFRSFRPIIYPQGSMPLGTTVKPVEGPHDLDFVLELSLSHVNVDPLFLLDQLFRYLKSHGTYSSMVSRKNRCVRITYADEFYMDILPGCKDIHAGGTCIQVPDRELECWKPSNPIGYLRWFGIQNKLGPGLRILEKAMPLPAQQSTEEKRPLQLAVQLFKRWRDLYYATPDLAPISIVLTTLAADVYKGEQSVSQTLSNILARITDRIVAAEDAGDRVRVHNPSNLQEDLSERWNGNRNAYNAFTSGIRAFNRQLQDLIRRTGDVNPPLQRLFGETVDTVLIKRAKQVQDERRRGALGVTKSGLITPAVAGVLPVRGNTFHGMERRFSTAVNQEELGRRLRQAREACGLTQEHVAEHLGVSRPTVAQMELGNRAITSLELDRLAWLYARDMREFVAEHFADDDIVHALFRSHPDAGDTEVQEALRECIALGHELTRLEEHLGLSRAIVTAAAYPVASLRTKWEAIQTGARIAQEERRRLGLGVAPAGDLVQLLESEGVRTGIVAMPDEVSGLTISHPRVGLFVVVNRNHAPVRQRFSFCHEYAHVLLDRSAVGRISRTTERTDLVEVRANSFAANFLMPEEGVRQFVGGLGKGAASRIHTEIFDEEGVVPVDARTEPGTQDLQLYDVVQLGHFFGVSILSALFRLRNLKLVSESQFDQLRAQDEQGSSQLIASVLGIRTMSDVDHLGEFTRRFLGMALEAYRRERITKAKLFELAARIHLGHDRVEQLLEGAGLTAEEPDVVLLPGA